MPKARSFFGIFRAAPQQRARRLRDIQAIFCRRCHQPSRAPLASIRPGRLGRETSVKFCAKYIFWTNTCARPGKGHSGPAICAFNEYMAYQRYSASSCTAWAHDLVLLLIPSGAGHSVAMVVCLNKVNDPRYQLTREHNTPSDG